jgi:hypothetical protein
MPHMNNLDLAVFPCMSKMHSNPPFKQYSNEIAPAEETHENCKQCSEFARVSKV